MDEVLQETDKEYGGAEWLGRAGGNNGKEPRIESVWDVGGKGEAGTDGETESGSAGGSYA